MENYPQNIFNRALFMRSWVPKSFASPQDIVRDEHLTATQKKFVLHTMLHELQYMEDTSGEVQAEDVFKRKKLILKARSSL